VDFPEELTRNTVTATDRNRDDSALRRGRCSAPVFAFSTPLFPYHFLEMYDFLRFDSPLCFVRIMQFGPRRPVAVGFVSLFFLGSNGSSCVVLPPCPCPRLAVCWLCSNPVAESDTSSRRTNQELSLHYDWLLLEPSHRTLCAKWAWRASTLKRPANKKWSLPSIETGHRDLLVWL
jgi:hypothetical protein